MIKLLPYFNFFNSMKLFQPKTNFKNKHPPPKKIMNTKLLEANSTNNSTFDWSTGEVTEHRCASMSSKDCIVSCIDICGKLKVLSIISINKNFSQSFNLSCRFFLKMLNIMLIYSFLGILNCWMRFYMELFTWFTDVQFKFNIEICCREK